MKTKSTAIFIEANRVEAGMEIPDELHVFCVTPEVLDAFVRLHSATPTKAEINKKYDDLPVYWNDDKLNFECWVWNSVLREWDHSGFHYDFAWFQPGHGRFVDGEETIFLICKERFTEKRSYIVSFALSFRAISSLVEFASTDADYLLATTSGITFFDEFESFEYMFLNATGDPMKAAPPQGKLLSRRAWI